MEHDQVTDSQSFAIYVEQLRSELDDPDQASAWEYADLGSFLSAMAAWAVDWNEPAQPNPWRHAADVITAATVYE